MGRGRERRDGDRQVGEEGRGTRTTSKLARRLDLASCAGCAVLRLPLGRGIEFAQQLAHTRHCRRIELVCALGVDGDTHPACRQLSLPLKKLSSTSSRAAAREDFTCGSPSGPAAAGSTRCARAALTSPRVHTERALEQMVPVLRDLGVDARVRVLQDHVLDRILVLPVRRGALARHVRHELFPPRCRGGIRLRFPLGPQGVLHVPVGGEELQQRVPPPLGAEALLVLKD